MCIRDSNWTIESIKPYVETCIEIFGSTRIIFGTNWPVDGLWSEYSKVINAYKKITDQLSKSEREAFFFKNAEFLYKI